METKNPEKLKEDKKRGIIGSIGIHALLLLLFLLPILSYQDPPPEKEGVLVSFGQPNVGQGDDLPDTQNEKKVNNPSPAREASKSIEKVQPLKEQKLDAPTRKKAEVQEDILTSEESDAMKVQTEEEKAAEAEAQRKAELEAARKKAAAEEAERQRKYKKAKKQFGNVFGKGKGETEVQGNQGDPDGAPDAANLKGISTGSGVVGGGLGDRGVRYSPRIRDRSQKSGKVVINVCVNNQGEVVSANYTQRGSTTTDRQLKKIAEKNARKFRFTESDIDKQCGTITIDFQLE